jgi:hypothetical protein
MLYMYNLHDHITLPLWLPQLTILTRSINEWEITIIIKVIIILGNIAREMRNRVGNISLSFNFFWFYKLGNKSIGNSIKVSQSWPCFNI